MGHPQDSQKRHLLLGTVSFTVCFAAWGLISAFAPQFSSTVSSLSDPNGLSGCSTSSAGRAGAHSDRNAGRPLWRPCCFHRLDVLCRRAGGLGSGYATSYQNLLVVAFLLGMAGSSFAVGVGYVSRWFSMESQGSALGVYGLGNIGQSAAVFLGPVVAAAYGFRTVYWGMSIILLVWAVGLRGLCSECSPNCLVPRASPRCSAYSHANLWRGRSRHSIF